MLGVKLFDSGRLEASGWLVKVDSDAEALVFAICRWFWRSQIS
jgi:hypothetical protein